MYYNNLHPLVDDMYSLGGILANGRRTVVDRSFPPDDTCFSVTAGLPWSDLTDTRQLQAAV